MTFFGALFETSNGRSTFTERGLEVLGTSSIKVGWYSYRTF